MKNETNKQPRKYTKRLRPDVDKSVADFEEKTGYVYNDLTLLQTALTHSSYANEMKNKGIHYECNQRLEFLGDTVLSLITSEYIFTKLGGYQEGELTRVRSVVVCEDALFKFADSLELGEALFLGKGEIISNGRRRKSILADAFEALLGSVFIDGGLEAARGFLMKFIEKPVEDIVNRGKIKDYKSLLQQVIQQTEGEVLEYKLSGESGPPHEKIFNVCAVLNNNVVGEGEGASKKEAEQQAAKEALRLFGIE
jgi:ribonuclease-3